MRLFWVILLALLTWASPTWTQTFGWIFPTTSTFTADSSSNGKILSSDNVPGGSITVTLPTPSVVGAGWQMGFSEAGGHGLILNAQFGTYILAGQKTLTSITLPTNTNYEYLVLQSDGTNLRVTTITDVTRRFNGITGTVGGQVWNYLYTTGYAATLGDNGTVLASKLAGGPMTITLPSTPLIPNGWSVTLYAAVNTITVVPNSVSGGTLVTPQGAVVSAYTIPINAGGSTVSFDGSAFRVMNAIPSNYEVSNNAALLTLATQSQISVVRDGFTTAGDGGYAIYNHSSSPCSLNSGAGDNGSQVLASDGGCWIANFNGPVNVRVWGCVGNGVADDTACIQAGLTALSPTKGELSFPPGGYFKITSGLTNAGVRMQGNYVGNGFAAHLPTDVCPIGITVATANITALSLTGDASIVDSLCIDNATITNTNGTTISVGSGNNSIVSNNQIIGSCTGIDVSGVGTTQNVATVIDKNSVIGGDHAGCSDLRIGHNTTGSNTTDTKITGNGFFCPSATNLVGVRIEDAGGVQFTSNDVLACGYGTVIMPGTNQQVLFTYFTGTVLGDSSNTNDFLVDTAAATGLVRSVNIVNGWAASSANGPSVLVQNTGGGQVWGVHFTGSRIYPHESQVGVIFTGSGALSDLTLDSSMVCEGNSSTATAAVIVDMTGRAAVRNNTIGVCDGPFTGVDTGIGISLEPSGGVLTGIFTGNILENLTTPLVFAGNTSTSAVIIKDNDQTDTFVPTFASGSSVTIQNSTLFLTGTAVIHTVLPVWPGRQMMIIPTGLWSTDQTGNIGTTGTATVGVPTTWVFNGTKWNIHY